MISNVNKFNMSIFKFQQNSKGVSLSHISARHKRIWSKCTSIVDRDLAFKRGHCLIVGRELACKRQILDRLILLVPCCQASTSLVTHADFIIARSNTNQLHAEKCWSNPNWRIYHSDHIHYWHHKRWNAIDKNVVLEPTEREHRLSSACPHHH